MEAPVGPGILVVGGGGGRVAGGRGGRVAGGRGGRVAGGRGGRVAGGRGGRVANSGGGSGAGHGRGGVAHFSITSRCRAFISSPKAEGGTVGEPQPPKQRQQGPQASRPVDLHKE